MCDYSESGTFRNEKQTDTFNLLKIIYVDNIINSCSLLYCFTMLIYKFFYKNHRRIWMLFSACLGCKLVPVVGVLNEDNICVGCQHKKRCSKCWRFLPPHLFCDEDGDWCNACIRKSSQTGGATVYQVLKDTLEEQIIDGGDDQTSTEFFLHSNNTERRRILARAINTHMYVLKLVLYIYILISPRFVNLFQFDKPNKI